MPELQYLKSRHFRINGKAFECIGTLGTDSKDDCIDILRNQATGQLHRVKRSHTLSQKIMWLGQEDSDKRQRD